MGRPTEDPKRRVIGVRISEEISAFLEKEGRKKSEIIREAIESYVKQNDSFVKQKKGFVKQNESSFVKQNGNNVKQNTQEELPDGMYKDFLSMAKCYGMTYVVLMGQINDLINNGSIYIDNGKMITKDSRLNTDSFFKKCEELGYSGKEQAVLDKLVKGMVVKK